MIDQLYLQKQSVIHDLNIWSKFICFLLILPTAILFGNETTLFAATLMCLVLVVLSRIPIRIMWKQVRLYVLTYILLFIPAAILLGTGTYWFRLEEGLIFAVKMTDVTFLGLLFAMTTDPIELPLGLLLFKLPHKYGITLMVAYRMLPLIGDKLTCVIRAQKSRGADFNVSLRRLPQNFRALISLLVPLVSSSLEASEGLADTLIARGYSPKRRITIPPVTITIRDVLLPLALIVSGLLLQVLGNM
jgi:energy-coupling factor transporter transmembrane protein EcfT